jgi:4-hydroxy-2-oxoheptanedioate aldolase
MLKNPLLEKVRKNETALGLWITEPDMVELSAFLGLDWFMIDMMFTGLDFGRTQYLIRTGEAAGITPVVRVQSNPWLGYDPRIAVDVTRLQGMGAQFVLISHSCKKEIETNLEVAKDWHRRALWVHPFRSREEWGKVTDAMVEQTYIIPHAESEGALEELEETMALPGLKMFFIAMTDASKVITQSKTPDWYHKKLWEYVAKAVKLGEKYGVMVGANTSYAYTMKEMQDRVRILHEAGVKFIMIQGAQFLFQVAMSEFLQKVRSDLKLK